MAVDQATFDAALQQFAEDVAAGLAQVPPPAEAPDFTTELDTLNSIKAQFDAFVASVTPAPAEPATPPPA